MGYPTGVFSPSARSNGQTIDAAHVNDLQTEVAAIETALLGTITHSLNVSGNSTLAGLQAGESTLSELFVSKPPPSAIVASTAVQVANNTPAQIAFSSQLSVYPTSMHSTSANSSRLVAPSSGVYMVTAALEWNGFSTVGVRVVSLLLNDTTVIATDRRRADPTLTNALEQTITTVRSLSASDYLSLRVLHDSGGTGSIGVIHSFGLTKIR